VARAKAYLHAKFHLDPSNRLATIHKRYRETDRTGQTGQRSDSIGRTVLQMVAQKRRPIKQKLSVRSDLVFYTVSQSAQNSSFQTSGHNGKNPAQQRRLSLLKTMQRYYMYTSRAMTQYTSTNHRVYIYQKKKVSAVKCPHAISNGRVLYSKFTLKLVMSNRTAKIRTAPVTNPAQLCSNPITNRTKALH